MISATNKETKVPFLVPLYGGSTALKAFQTYSALRYYSALQILNTYTKFKEICFF